MHITRRYTQEGQDPYTNMKFGPRTSRIVNPDGSQIVYGFNNAGLIEQVSTGPSGS